VEFKPTVSASERAKAVHALDREAAVTGALEYAWLQNYDLACRSARLWNLVPDIKGGT
jgi:hypothetical protein